MKKTAKVFVALLLAFVMVFTMVAAVACTPEEPVDPNQGGTGGGSGTGGSTPATPFATAPFNAILTMGDPTAEDGEFTVLQMSNVETAEDSGYYNAMILVGVGDDAISLAYAIEDKTVTFYPYDGSAVGATSCGTGTIDGKNFSTHITGKLSDEDEDHTYDISGEMYTLTITGTEDLESWDFPTSLFVSKDSYVGLVLAFQLGDETLTLNGTAVESIETLKMPAQNSTIAIAAAPVNYGTEEEPISVDEALAVAAKECAEKDTFTTQQIFVTGKVATQPGYNSEKSYYTQFNLEDLSSGNTIIVYTMSNDAEAPAPDQNDTIVIKGYIKNFSGTIEFASNGQDYVQLLSTTKGTSTITQGAHEGATITGLPESGTNGSEITFNVAPDSGKKIVSVKVGTTTLTAEGDGSYKFTLHGNSTVTVETADEGAVVPQLVATVDLSAKTNYQANQDGTTNTITANGVTITQTKGSSGTFQDPTKASDHWRFHQKTTFKLEYTSEVQYIIIYCQSKYATLTDDNGPQTVAGMTITEDSDNLTIKVTLDSPGTTIDLGALQKQIRVVKVEVYA